MFEEPSVAPNGDTTQVGTIRLELGDVLGLYRTWERPTVIVVDGPYGLGQFPGDPPTPEGLPDWYGPHVAAWTEYALPETTLWFWNSEVGWATVHNLLTSYGWEYRAAHVWDKGVGHIAGNVNSKTIRGFPVVTELCVQYVRRVELAGPDGRLRPLKEWLRAEWLRAGLPLYKTNEASGVKNAATRKYFTQDHLWYFPPARVIERLADYANKYGRDTDWPYFSLDGKRRVTAGAWLKLRAKWSHTHGLTNVWSEPAVRGDERLKNDIGYKCLHANQKPVKLLERLIRASSEPGDVVWEPFGGLCSTAVAAVRAGRGCYSAEINPAYYQAARQRLASAEKASVLGSRAS